MPNRVLDASVLASVIFQEPRAEEADALNRGAELQAPQHLIYELTHIAQKKSSQYPDQRRAFEQSLETALSMNIRWREVEPLAVLRLALETGLSTYDASYLYLAQALGLPLVTFDQRLQAAIRGLG